VTGNDQQYVIVAVKSARAASSIRGIWNAVPFDPIIRGNQPAAQAPDAEKTDLDRLNLDCIECGSEPEYELYRKRPDFCRQTS